METRKNNVFTFVIDEKEDEIIEFRKQIPIDFKKAQQIPDFRFIIERFLSLKPENTAPNSVFNSVMVQITNEIHEACENMNIITKAKKNIKKIVETTVDEFTKIFIK